VQPAGLQAYCDSYIGVDCSGFVANYANSALGTSFDVLNTQSTTFAPPAKRRADLDSVEALDAIVWTATNHVAVIDRLDLDRIALSVLKSADGKRSFVPCTVVESNGSKGLHNSDYVI
jgi:hypothetical protein